MFYREVTDEEFHPRAMKLIRERRNFIVIAQDEPYFMEAYTMIRLNEKAKGTWTEEDERHYADAAAKVFSHVAE